MRVQRELDGNKEMMRELLAAAAAAAAVSIRI